MNKKTLAKLARSTFLVLIAAVLLFGVVALPHAQAATYAASAITKRDDIQVDYTQYLNTDVMYPLPAGVGSEEEISVIITVDVPNLMDAYDAGDKTMSFAEYALGSEEAAALEAQMASEKARILSQLDELEISYTTGEDYSRLLSGFEILIRAGDFNAVCQSLGEGEGTIVSEEYKVAETQLVENTVNVYETGIFKSGESGYDGTGMVVAVLDTGLDSNHSAFSVENFTSDHLGMTYEDVAAKLPQTQAYKLAGGLSVDDVYINEKVPFG